MRPTHAAFRPRSSALVRLGVAAVAATVLMGIPTARAHAADEEPSALATRDMPVTVLAERLEATRRDAGERLRALAADAFARTASRMSEARLRMELVLASLDSWEPVETDARPVHRPTHGGRTNKLEIVTGTDDPLAGL